MGITVAVSGTTGSSPTPACKFFTLTSQNKLPELYAAIGLQLGFGEEMAAIGNIAAAVAISCQDGIIFLPQQKVPVPHLTNHLPRHRNRPCAGSC